MKSAYEVALERMESEGIDRPREQAFSAETLQAIEQVRSKAEARVAELEIMHQKKLGEIFDPLEIEQQEKLVRTEKARIEASCDREVEKLRSGP
jgi:hypothetical protein